MTETIATRYVFQGDETRAIQIAGLGRHHMKVLHNLMSFQDLKQSTRTVTYRDGTVIKCSSLFGHDKIDIFAPQGVIDIAPIQEEFPEKVWEFKLYRDDDTTIRDGAGNITTPSGLPLDIWNFGGIYLHTGDWPMAALPPVRDHDLSKYWSYNNKTKIWTYDDSIDWPDFWWKGTYNENTGWFTIQVQKENKSVDDLYWVEYSTAESTKISDPAIDAAVSTSNVDGYIGVVVSLTEAGKSQTLQPPTDKTAGRTFIVKASESNVSYTISVNGKTLSAGEHQGFVWNGSAWGTSTIDFPYGIETQYPYKYKAADKEKIADKISMGSYGVNLPYWEIVGQKFTPTPIVSDIPLSCEYTQFTLFKHLYDNSIYLLFNRYHIMNAIKCSVPYKIKYTIEAAGIHGAFGRGKFKCGDEELVCDWLYASDTGDPLRYGFVTYVSDEGLINVTQEWLEYTSPGENIFTSEFLSKPTSIEIENESTVTINNTKTDGYYFCFATWPDIPAGYHLTGLICLREAGVQMDGSGFLDVEFKYE